MLSRLWLMCSRRVASRKPVKVASIAVDIDVVSRTSLISAIMPTTLTTFALNLLVIVFTMLWTACPCTAQSSTESSSLIIDSSQAVLLKKTDRILVGTVRLNGNFYEIDIADQSRVSIPRDHVEFVGANEFEVYQYKCRSISRWMPGDHFKMARWCLQNKLVAQATEHYDVVAKAAPDYPLVKQLGVEIEQKILSDEKFRAYAGMPPLVQTQVASKEPASGNTAVTMASNSQRQSNAQASSTTMVTDHPQIAVYFNDRVQPILMNRCSQSACHGVASKNALRILEPVGTAYSRVSSENLRSALAQVTRDASGTPKLLSYATKPHGLQRQAGIALTETNLIEELKNWIQFSENPIVPAVATTPVGAPAGANTPASKLNPIPPGSSPLRAVPQNAGGARANVEFPSGAAKPTTSEIDALEAQLNQILAKEQPTKAASEDPFDPAAFNRQR